MPAPKGRTHHAAMKEDSNLNAGPLRKREAEAPYEAAPENGQHRLAVNGNGQGHGQPPPVDAWTVLDFLARRWHWLAIGTLVAGTGFFLLGRHLVKPKFIASAELLRFDSPGQSDFFKTAPVSSDTFAEMMRAPELLRAAGQSVTPAIPPETLTKFIKIDSDDDSDMMKVQLVAGDPETAAKLLNAYVNQVVAYTTQLEKEQVGKLAHDYLKQQVAEMDADISDLTDEFRRMPLSPVVTNGLAQFGGKLKSMGSHLAATAKPTLYNFTEEAERLQKAESDLQDLLVRYTDFNPQVQAKRQYIKELEGQLQRATGTTNLPMPGFIGPVAAGGNAASRDVDIVEIKLKALVDSRQDLVKREREAELYAKNPAGSVRVFASADPKNVRTNLRPLKISIVTFVGAMFGLAGSIALVLLVEFFDHRLKTVEDVKRVTKLPVLTTLGDLHSMKPEERSQWAFRAWTMLQGRLSPSPNFGLVCGITSCAPGEGRSTWISLLAEAASMTGFRVLTIATRPSSSYVEDDEQELLNGERAAAASNGTNHQPQNHSSNPSNAITTSVLSSPGQVTAQLTGPNSQPVVHIPLPGWVWNLERRKQWREALEHWRKIENLVILVELPPASVPEAVLLGSNLPNMLWLAKSGRANAAATRAQLETLRDARCNLVGAVLNGETEVPLRKRFPRWLGCLALAAALSGLSARAQETNAAPQEPAAVESSGVETNSSPAPAVSAPVRETEPAEQPGWFSIVNPSQRAAWQRHLTLGAGDVLTMGLYGDPELTQAEVPIGPDGRVNYLEATNVLATGLTVDELRAKLDQALSLYRRSPRTIVMPVAFHSKKYYVLGKVVTRGVYTLDRPITVLEALARAHGLETALVDRNVVSLADFQRSFLARGGKRYPLDFERLFERGDLSQNIAVEPGDYIYFAAGDVPQVYVVGEVRLPGVVTYMPDLTVMSAITERGGYTDRAYKAKVLVIRGSLQNPERFVVNTHAILDAKELNFKLQPRDIIYVNSRPFIKVEEEADMAMTAFIQSLIYSWVGVDIVQPGFQ